MVICHLSYSTCLTPGSVEPRKAAAGEGAQAIQAAGSIYTRVGNTLIHVHLTHTTSVALHTLTPADTDAVLAPAGLWTAHRVRLPHYLTAVLVHCCVQCGFLPKVIDRIQARASIHTGGAVALVNVHLTVLSRESSSTVTDVTTCLILTNATIDTRVGKTFIYLQFTSRSCLRKMVSETYTWWNNNVYIVQQRSNLWSLPHNCRQTCWPRPHKPLHSDRGRKNTHSPQLHRVHLEQRQIESV